MGKKLAIIIHKEIDGKKVFVKADSNEIIPKENIKMITYPSFTVHEDRIRYTKKDLFAEFKPYYNCDEVNHKKIKANALLIGEILWLPSECAYNFYYRTGNYCKVKGLTKSK